MASKLSKRISLAIIDDYLGTSAPHFAHIPAARLNIATFKQTVVPVNDKEDARLVKHLKPSDAISTIRERTAFPAHLLRRLPNLRLFLATGTQFETFDLAAARDQGVAVVAAPGLGRTDAATARSPNIKNGAVHPTTQHTWALIMALARNVARDNAALKAGSEWQTGLAKGLTGLTLGIVGFGRLGAAVARIGHLAWSMKVVCWSQNLTQEKADAKAVEMGLPVEKSSGEKTFTAVGKEELFRAADVVSLHYVLSDRSRGIVSAMELGLMKKGAMLINASRGPLVDASALLDALERGNIWGAALDVFDIEPLPLDSRWRRMDYWSRNGRSRLVITPHMGYADESMMNTWYAETAENVERCLDGKELLHRIAYAFLGTNCMF